jgi:hypothetical protein
MSIITNLTSTSSALPPVNIHPHGHKKGAQAASAGDFGSDTAAQVPAGTAQNLFRTMLQSLEQVIGVQLGATASTATPTAATTAASTTTGAGATASSNVTPALTSAGAASYLQANGAQTPKAAGSNVSVTA